MAFNCVLRVDGQLMDAANLIGTGTDGFIIRQGCHVLKIPKLVGTTMPYGEVVPHGDNSLCLSHRENEKRVYERRFERPFASYWDAIFGFEERRLLNNNYS